MSSIHGFKVILRADTRWTGLEGENGGSHRQFSWARLEVATYFFHHNLLARTWSSGPTHLPGRLRNIV